MKKKDYNMIAAYEKAIAEKYGKIAAQDFRGSWEPEKEKEYLNQVKKRKAIRDVNRSHKKPIEVGEILIYKKNKNQTKNRTCPVCKTYSFSPKDDLYMNRFDCCYACYVDFVESDEEEWRNGNRPDESYMQRIIRGRK